MRTQFITDDEGRKVAVIIDMKKYRKILDELDELEDIRLYDEAKKDKGKPVPIEKAFKKIEAKRRSA